MAATVEAVPLVSGEGAEREPPPSQPDANAERGPDPEPAPLLFSSTMSRGGYHQCGSGRRVKFYVLENQAWADRGTGYCAGVYDEKHDEALLVARKEETCTSLGSVADASVPEGVQEGDASPQEYMLVVSESLASDDFLLHAPVIKDDVYQRQQDTLVVWTALDGTDMALSFQELEGCNEVWDFITEVQNHFVLSRGLEYGKSLEAALPPFELPPPTLANLTTIEEDLRLSSLHSVAMRDKVIEWLLKEDYIRSLTPLLKEAEEQHALPALHRLFEIMKTILLMNDNLVVEYLLQDDVFFAVAGMLEYNPERPHLKASYRLHLSDEAKFHQVVDFDDPTILAKIFETYRLVYLKDVMLAGLVDDALLSMLNSLVFFYQNDIVNYCINDPQLWTQLEQVYQAPTDDTTRVQKAKGVVFVQHLCTMGKQIQLPGRIALFRCLIDGGVLPIIEYALSTTDTALQVAASDILSTLIEYDANSVRAYILKEVHEEKTPLLCRLQVLLHDGQDPALCTQWTEAVRALMDMNMDGLAHSPMGQGLAAKSRIDVDELLTWLYDGTVQQLLEPLRHLPDMQRLPLTKGIKIDSPQWMLYSHLCDLLCFIIEHHSFRSQYYILTSNVCSHVGSLLHAQNKHMRLAALRVLRACVSSHNQFTYRHLMQLDVMGHVLALLQKEAPRDNLVSSACLGLFEQLRRDNVRPLLSDLVQKHNDMLEALRTDPIAGHGIEALLQQQARNQSSGVSDSEDSLTGSPTLNEEAAEQDYFDSEEALDVLPHPDKETDIEALAPLMERRRKHEEEEDDLVERVAKRPASDRQG
ncbi:Platinum sensitivity protein [Malassezia equina]|uniref:Platinum sensitivity protein n=1 Tax=Malassezia equina TaxID=1381935 RepID=A0AAF0ED80_9BASI|nr:Platinum sensitivity protein [Malassezia equina]